jgi:hypothetical protein
MHRQIAALCKKLGIDDPLDLPTPRLTYSELQSTLERRAEEHAERDIARWLDDAREEYHNGALFGLDPTIAGDEQDSRWEVAILPTEGYMSSPRLAGSAWKHTERRHRGDAK